MELTTGEEGLLAKITGKTICVLGVGASRHTCRPTAQLLGSLLASLVGGGEGERSILWLVRSE